MQQPAVKAPWESGATVLGVLLRACLSAIALLFCASPIARAGASGDGPVRFGLSLHVATEGGRAVVDDAFIVRQIAAANRIFAPYAVQFEEVERHTRGARHARMETRADRHALGAHVRPRFINVFLVASLRDVDEPERMRRGVHWHSQTHAPAHFVIVSAAAFDAVLAHELGHFLGNRQHSQTPGNLMSYQHTDVLPFLDAPQVRRLQRALRGYLRSGELVDLSDAKARAEAKRAGSAEVDPEAHDE